MYMYYFDATEPLHHAVENENLSAVIKLLEAQELANKIHIDTLDRTYHVSALTIACAKGNLEIVTELLNRGARLDIGGLRLRRCAFDEAMNYPHLLPIMLKKTRETVDNYQNLSSDVGSRSNIALLAFSLADYYHQEKHKEEIKFSDINLKNTCNDTFIQNNKVDVEDAYQKYLKIANQLTEQLHADPRNAGLYWRRGYHFVLKKEFEFAKQSWMESLRNYLLDTTDSFFQVLVVIESLTLVLRYENNVSWQFIFSCLLLQLDLEPSKKIFLKLTNLMAVKTKVCDVLHLMQAFLVLETTADSLSTELKQHITNLKKYLAKRISEASLYSHAIKNAYDLNDVDKILCALNLYKKYYEKIHDNSWVKSLRDYVAKIMQLLPLGKNPQKNAEAFKKFEELVNILLVVKDREGLQEAAIKLQNIFFFCQKLSNQAYSIELQLKTLHLAVKCFNQLIKLNWYVEDNYILMKNAITITLSLREKMMAEKKLDFEYQRHVKSNRKLEEKIQSLATPDFINQVFDFVEIFYSYPGILDDKNTIRFASQVSSIYGKKIYQKGLELEILCLDLTIKNKAEIGAYGIVSKFCTAVLHGLAYSEIDVTYAENLLNKINSGVDFLLTIKFRKDNYNQFYEDVSLCIDGLNVLFTNNNKEQLVFEYHLLKLKVALSIRDLALINASANLIIKNLSNQFSSLATNEKVLKNNLEKTWQLFESFELFNYLIYLFPAFIRLNDDQTMEFIQNKIEELETILNTLSVKSEEEAIALYNSLHSILKLIKNVNNNGEKISNILYTAANVIKNYDKEKYIKCLNEIADSKLKAADSAMNNNEIIESILLRFEVISLYKESKNEAIEKLINELISVVTDETKKLIAIKKYPFAIDLVRQMIDCAKHTFQFTAEIALAFEILKAEAYTGLTIAYCKKGKWDKAAGQYAIATKTLNKISDKYNDPLLEQSLQEISHELNKNIYQPTPSQNKIPESNINTSESVGINGETKIATAIKKSKSPRRKKFYDKESKQKTDPSKNENNNSQKSFLSSAMLIGKALHGGSFLNSETSTIYPVIDLASKDVLKLMARNPLRFRLFKRRLLEGKITTAFGHDGIKYCGFWEVKVHGSDRLKGETKEENGKNYVIFNTRFRK